MGGKVYSKGYLYGEREPSEYQGQGRYLRDILKAALNYGNVLYPAFPREYEVTSAQWEVRNQQDALRKAAAPYKIKAYAKLANANEVKQAIMSGMGVIFSAACSHLKANAKGILPMNEPNYGHHCMAIIGWDDNYEGNAYAYCPQSWGTGFGLNGFCYVSWTDIFRDYDVWAMTFAEATDPTKPYIRRTLRNGMEGDDVKELQTLLGKNGYSIVPDGVFGSNTEEAVRKYQATRNLTADGVVGPKTWAELDAAPAEPEPIKPSAMLDEFIAYLEEQVKNHSGYCWGAQGQLNSTATNAWIRGRETSTTNANRAIAFKNKQVAAGYGNVMRWFDCSGLGMYFLQNSKGIYKGDMSANSMMGKCTKITRGSLKRGDWVFRVDANGKAYHIGYIVDDGLNVIEARGRDDGVVKRALNASGTSYWNAYGRPTAFESEPQPEPTPAPTASMFAVCTGDSVNLRAGRGTQYDILGVVRKDDKLLAMPAIDGWHEVAAVIGGKVTAGYISGKYIKEA